MGVTSDLMDVVSIPKSLISAALAPVGGLLTTMAFIPTLLATSVLWGMTTKPQDNQRWTAGDYLIVIPVAFMLARSGMGGIV